MTNKKDLIIAVLPTFFLTLALFSVMPTRSQQSRVYDPWADLTGPDGYEDGVINMRDIGYVANLFGTAGDPTRNVNVTNLPLDEQGNLRVSGFAFPLEEHNYTEVINVFITETQWDPSSHRYFGGLRLNSIGDNYSKLCFVYSPVGTSVNITGMIVCMTVVPEAQSGSDLYSIDMNIAINGYETYPWHTERACYTQTLTTLAIPNKPDPGSISQTRNQHTSNMGEGSQSKLFLCECLSNTDSNRIRMCCIEET